MGRGNIAVIKMTEVRCNAKDCIHNEYGFCDLDILELREMKCTRFKPIDESFYEEDWEEV